GSVVMSGASGAGGVTARAGRRVLPGGGVPADARGVPRRLAEGEIAGRGLAGGGGLVERLPLSLDEVHELRRRVAGDRVGVLAGLVVDRVGLEVPDDLAGGPPGRGEHVGGGDHVAVVLFCGL